MRALSLRISSCSLLAGVALRAGAEQAAGDGGGFALAGEGCGVAEAKLDGGVDLIVLGFLGQDDDLHAVIEFRAATRLSMLAGVGSKTSAWEIMTVLL